jgi:hypothetical protein
MQNLRTSFWKKWTRKKILPPSLMPEMFHLYENISDQ